MVEAVSVDAKNHHEARSRDSDTVEGPAFALVLPRCGGCVTVRHQRSCKPTGKQVWYLQAYLPK